MNAAIIQICGLKGAESDGYTAHQASLDRLPCHVHQIFQRPRLLNLRQRCGERNAFGRWLIEKHVPDWLIVLMLPKQRERILELHAQRFDNIPCAIRNGTCCKPADNALFAVNGFDIKNRVCAIKFHVFLRHS